MPDKLHSLVHSLSPEYPLSLPLMEVLAITPLPFASDGSSLSVMQRMTQFPNLILASAFMACFRLGSPGSRL